MLPFMLSFAPMIYDTVELKYYSARPFFDFVGCDADNHVLARVEIRRKLEEAPL